MDKNTLAKLNVVCLLLKHKEEESKSIKDGNYADEIQYLISHNRRNKFIFNLCDTLKGNTLLLYQMVEKHGMVLYQLCQKLDRDLHFVYGGVDAQEREEVRRLTEKSDKSLIIASYGTFSTGINIKNINNVIFASPSKSRIRVLQSINRGLRKSETKNDVTLYDISDDLSYKNKKNFTLRHFEERINIYNEEEFDYRIDKVNL